MGFIRNVAVIVEPIDFKKFRENLERSVCHLSAQFSDSANDRSEEKTLIQLKLCEAGCVRIHISCFRPSYVMKNNREQEQTSKFIVGERYENHDHPACLDYHFRPIDRRGAS